MRIANAAKRLTRGLRQRGNVWYLSFQRDKKRRWICLHKTTLDAALIEATRIRHSPQFDSGIFIRHSVDRFVEEMVERRKRGERRGWATATAGSKKYVLRTFAAWCGRIQPNEVDCRVIKRYYDHRVKNTSATTAFGNLMTLSSYFNWCARIEKSVTRNPCANLANLEIHPPARRPRKDFCDPELRDKLIDECPRLDLKYVLFCGFHCGLRFLEIVESVPWWFDLKERRLHLRKTPTIDFKDLEERTIPLTREFVRFIKKDYGLQSPFMLHPENDKHGDWRYRYDFSRPFRLYMKDQGVPWVTPHIMRHTFASLLASTHPMDGGASDFEICTWMGIDLRTYQKTYAKLRPRPNAIDSAFRAMKRH